jgi:hypothetical protein
VGYPKNVRTSCDLLVLVDQATELVASLNAVRLGGQGQGSGPRERPGSEREAAGGCCGAVRIREGRPWRVLVDDQDSVEQFAAEGADESVRRSRWLAVLALVSC